MRHAVDTRAFRRRQLGKSWAFCGAATRLMTPVLLLAVAAESPVAAAPRWVPLVRPASLPAVESHGERSVDLVPKVRGSAAFQRTIHRALALLSGELSSTAAQACRRYFARQGVDLASWLDPLAPPFVVEVPRTWFPRRLRRKACAASQGGPPYLYLFIASNCARPDDPDGVASLVLHELGHLARQDSKDAEPLEFFARCELAGGIQPGRFH